MEKIIDSFIGLWETISSKSIRKVGKATCAQVQQDARHRAKTLAHTLQQEMQSLRAFSHFRRKSAAHRARALR